MLKFFAKYQKIILVVGGSLLMVVFLLPAGGQFLQPNPAAESVGSIDGQEITRLDVRSAQGEVDLLSRINPQWERMFRFLEIDGLGWLLMQRDAENNGIYSPLSHARFSAGEIIASTPNLAQVLRTIGATEDQFAVALQHMEMFMQLQQLTMGARRPSEQRLAHFAKDIRSEASVRIVPIKAADRIDGAPAPTDAEIVAHFNEYKDKAPGETEPYGFGYRLPDRFKLEVITVPIKRVATTIEVNDLDGQKYYLEHQSDYLPSALDTTPDTKVGPDTKVVPAPEGPKPETTEPETTEPKATEPEAPVETPAPAPEATEPESNEDEAPALPATGIPGLDGPLDPLKPTTPELAPASKPLPYKQVRDKVFAKLRDERAAAKRDAIAQSIIGQLTTALRQSDKAKTQPSGYYDLEEGYEPLPFEKVQKSVQDEFGVLVDFERIDDRWLTADDVDEMDGLGSASIMVGDLPAPISRYIGSAREFKNTNAGPLTAERLQANVRSKIVQDGAGNAYIFRLIAVDPAHVPKTVDEPGVREMVAKDLKTLNVYKMLLKEKQQFVDTARNEGLAKLAENEGVETVNIPNFTGRDTIRAQWLGTLDPPSLPVVGESEAFVDGVFEIARKVEAAGGLGAGKAPPQLAVDAIPVDSQMLLTIVQLQEYEPIDSATYGRLKPQLNNVLIGLDAQQLGRSGVNPMSRDAIAKRVGFVRPDGWDDEDKTDDAPADDTEAAEQEAAE